MNKRALNVSLKRFRRLLVTCPLPSQGLTAKVVSLVQESAPEQTGKVQFSHVGSSPMKTLARDDLPAPVHKCFFYYFNFQMRSQTNILFGVYFTPEQRDKWWDQEISLYMWRHTIMTLSTILNSPVAPKMMMWGKGRSSSSFTSK
jgi:hypothetical protein